ncbi:hypothetical protein FRX31_003369 [Thalictrum thalictroides]|uniref:CLAVATA3/ESR (CLE)-related protein n=1 Tax=Thalictrum thalictroides TaxID=46969 RepID=A0A7J6XBB9_THATH|nr:hypothetical protein FRX31_003369 [Thalictrum thalictroides]
MSVAGGRRICVLPFMITLMMILVLQIWVCCDCKVGAIRILSEDLWAKEKEVVVVVEEQSNNMIINNNKKKKNIKEDDMLKKYFNGRNFDFNTTEKGLEDSKRRVPSCPDPLHNK